ncbi:MAG: hypothetical protein KC656_36900 [Myxococcales bacterium]|nr:hypothetical protein [Myxococcales bacterium]
MLDAYIIDRIRKERENESREGALIPLHIEVPQLPPNAEPPPSEEHEDKPDRGSVVIDFQV